MSTFYHIHKLTGLRWKLQELQRSGTCKADRGLSVLPHGPKVLSSVDSLKTMWKLSDCKPRRSSSLRGRRTRTVSSEVEANLKWKNLMINSLQFLLELTSVEHIITLTDVDDECIKKNVLEAVSSMQESTNSDIPMWAVYAMNCLETWSEETDAGFPRYDGFKRDVFDAIARYFCEGENFLDMDDLEENFAVFQKSFIKLQESILSPEICYAIDKLRSLTHEKLIKALQLCLLTLPPPKRRKLQVLACFMAKVSVNPHLSNLDLNLTAMDLVIQTFSSCIFPSNERNDADRQFISVTVALINHHEQIFRVPTSFISEAGLEMQMARTSDQGPNLHRAHSVDALRSFLSGSKPKFSIYKWGNKLRKNSTRYAYN